MKFVYPRHETGNAGKVTGCTPTAQSSIGCLEKLSLLEVEIPRASLSMLEIF
jgi:hypothetical protein